LIHHDLFPRVEYTSVWSHECKNSFIEILSDYVAQQERFNGTIRAAHPLPFNSISTWKIWFEYPNWNHGEDMNQCYFVGVIRGDIKTSEFHHQNPWNGRLMHCFGLDDFEGISSSSYFMQSHTDASDDKANSFCHSRYTF